MENKADFSCPSSNKAKLALPRCIPVFERFSPLEGEVSPVEYIYLPAASFGPGKVEAHIVQHSDNCSLVEKGDLVLVDRRNTPSEEERAACLVEGVLRTGNLRKCGAQLRLENSQGEFEVCWDQVAAVVGVERRSSFL